MRCSRVRSLIALPAMVWRELASSEADTERLSATRALYSFSKSLPPACTRISSAACREGASRLIFFGTPISGLQRGKVSESPSSSNPKLSAKIVKAISRSQLPLRFLVSLPLMIPASGVFLDVQSHVQRAIQGTITARGAAFALGVVMDQDNCRAPCGERPRNTDNLVHRFG